MRARVFIGIVLALVTLGALSVLYVAFIVVDGAPGGAYRNVSESMEPTLLPGDLFTVRFITNRTGLARDVLVAHAFPGNPPMELVKRIVAIAGDTVSMEDGQLVLNHRRVAEPFAWRERPDIDPVVDDFRWQRPFLVDRRDTARYRPSRDTWGPLVVPDGKYFVLGDNRDNSLDSRWFGFISADSVLGTVRRIYFSRDSTGHIRWQRLGRHPT